MPYDELKQRVYDANIAIQKAGLVVLTWGNASGADRSKDVFAIKPSGVSYDKLTPADIVVLSISTGEVVEGKARPSSDTPTHWHLYQKFEALGGVVHTHSTYGTAFAQAQREIPCLGTTHADNFYGAIPCTRPMTEDEIAKDYELNTGKVIVERFKSPPPPTAPSFLLNRPANPPTSTPLNPADIPGVLVASHAPFAWGATPEKAVENAIVLEFSAQMALLTFSLNPSIKSIPQPLLDKHFLRKHGKNAYYGQPNK